MHAIARLALVRRPLATATASAAALLDSSTSSTTAIGGACVFCQHRPSPTTRQRRAFADRHGPLPGPDDAQARPSDARRSAEEVAEDGSAAQYEPEFEFDVEPEADSAAGEVAGASGPQEVTPAQLQRMRAREATIRRREEEYATQMEFDRLLTAAAENPASVGYVPAETGKGLLRLGGKDPKDVVRPFRNFYHGTRPVQGQAQVTAATYRALVETVAAASAGRGAGSVTSAYIRTNILNATQRVRVSVDGGEVRLEYPDAATEAAVLDAGSAGEVEARENTEIVEEAVAGWGQAWLGISLADAEFKFSLLRRLSRLLGRPIADHIVSGATDISSLVAGVARPDPPATVFEALLREQNSIRKAQTAASAATPEGSADAGARVSLLKLPNVRVTRHPNSLIDKETSVGRWKVIEQELRERDLPVPGTNRDSGRGRRKVPVRR